ncbi:hypothetical protein SAMN05216227_10447 [Pseudorhodobacter antarcticus]|uniref:Uncharacterized protein n=1 Tax=Pseudorhodobacter antarcticus TaxID=1077947 RepID=A0A1H8LPM3_9RHOB|nr:hypothetical protein SAMN05216227_10447 [Pseudorhodobacter antarcticus]
MIWAKIPQDVANAQGLGPMGGFTGLVRCGNVADLGGFARFAPAAGARRGCSWDLKRGRLRPSIYAVM